MNTKLAKTSELTGQELDRAVHFLLHPNEPIKDGCTAPPYSSDWCFGGPIIERERIQLSFEEECAWYSFPASPAWIAMIGEGCDARSSISPDALVAAMRCYVASTLGDEIELPSSLFETSVD